MVQINDVSAERFSLNGVEYFKNFTPIVIGNRITIVNTYDSKIVIVPLTLFSDFEVDAVSYASAILLQSALLPVVFTRDSLGVTGAYLSDNPTDYSSATLPLTGTEVALLNDGVNWVKITWNNIKAQLALLFQYKLTAGTNITIDNTNPLAPVISASGGASVDISPKATNLLIVNPGLNGVLNYGNMNNAVLTGGTYVQVNGARISGLGCTNMRSTAATVGSFTALKWENLASLPAKAKAVGFLAIGSATLNATSRCFAGFYNAGFTLNNINYSTACYAGFANDTGDANLQFCRTITGGSIIKVDLGANFPARYTNGQHEYKFLIEIVSATTVNYKIKNIITGNSASGTFTDCAFVGSAVLGIAMNNNLNAIQTDLKFHSLIYAENYEF